jgi:phage FluMu protein gp41
MHKIIHDVETGEISQIELTAKEMADLEKEAEKVAIEQNAAKLQAEAKASEKAALLAKLGITDEEAKLLLS